MVLLKKEGVKGPILHVHGPPDLIFSLSIAFIIFLRVVLAVIPSLRKIPIVEMQYECV